MAKPRVLIVIAHDEFVRNYLEADTFREIRRLADVRLIAAERITRREVFESEEGSDGYFETPADLETKHLFLFNVLTWRYRKRSSSFRFRLKRHFGFQRAYEIFHARGIRPKLTALRRFVKYHILDRANWKLIFYGSGPIARRFVPRFIHDLAINESLKDRVIESSPDLILFPSSAYDPVGNDLARIGRDEGIPTLFVVDNWDGLSSKSVFWAHPKHLGAWGEQSRRHAVNIQGFAEETVHLLGTSRFERYFELRDQPLESPFPHPYILFVGCCLAFDEVSTLRILDREIGQNPELYGDTKIVYRPHPWRHPRTHEDSFEEREYQNVVLDPQLSGYDQPGTRLYPSLEYYGPLLANASLVIAPLTTMLLEAVIFRKHALVLAYDDGIHYDNPAAAWKSYEHFKGLDQFPSFTFCHRMNEVATQLRTSFQSRSEAAAIEGEQRLRHYLYWDERSYAERLAELVMNVAPTPSNSRYDPAQT